MGKYPLEKTLKDDSKIIIRELLPEDEEKSLAFFQSLPIEDRQYLRMDVTQMKNIKRRMNPGPFLNTWRIIAEQDNAIYGDGYICNHKTGWMRHVSEIRCIIHPEFKRKGLGTHLLWELFHRTLVDNTRIVFAEIMPEQKPAISVLEKLGFKLGMVKPKHVKDIQGKTHDLYVYTKDVKHMWDTLRQHLDEMDYEYPRS